MQESQPSSSPTTSIGRSRGRLILALGIIGLFLIPGDIIVIAIMLAGRYSANKGALCSSIALLTILIAPILGISAWLMANRYLRKIRDGIVPSTARGVTRTGKILGILSTFLVPPFIFIILISSFPAEIVLVSRDAMINDLKSLSAIAYQYRVRSLEKGGGAGSYEGYKLPQKMGENDNAIYTVTAVYRDSLILHGWSKPVDGTIDVKIGPDGRPTDTSWIYGGEFK